jgi:hypothetical protein
MKAEYTITVYTENQVGLLKNILVLWGWFQE